MNKELKLILGGAGHYNLRWWMRRAIALAPRDHQTRTIYYTNARGEGGVLVEPHTRAYLERAAAGMWCHEEGAVNWLVRRLAAAEVAPVVDEAGRYVQSSLYHEVWAGLIALCRRGAAGARQGGGAAVRRPCGGFEGTPEAVAWALLKAAVEVEGMGGDEWIAVVEEIGQ